MLRGWGVWRRTRAGRLGVVAVVLLVAAAVVVVVVQRGSHQSSSGTTVDGGTLTPGDFTPVPGTYDPALTAAFPNQKFQAQFGIRPPSSPSRTSYHLMAAIGATGLLRATTADGSVVGLNLLPIPAGFTLNATTTGFASTAVALIAISPGLLTDRPYADLLVDREIGVLPETQTVAAALAQAAKTQGPSYLAHPGAAVLSAVSAAVNALLARIRTDATDVAANPRLVLQSASPPSASSTAALGRAVSPALLRASYRGTEPSLPPSCDGPALSAVGGFEGDDICVAGLEDTSSGGTEKLKVRAVNRAPRWAFLYPKTGGGVLPLGVIEPKAWVIPGLSELMTAVSDAVANSSDFNGGKDAAGWLSGVVGGDYHPYLGSDEFLTQLEIQIRRFAQNTATTFSFTPDPARSVLTTTFGFQKSEDPGAPDPGTRAFVPSILTLYTQIIGPAVLVILDIKDDIGTATTPTTPAAGPAATTTKGVAIVLGGLCNSSGSSGYQPTSAGVLLWCHTVNTKMVWGYPEIGRTCYTAGRTAKTASLQTISCEPLANSGPLKWQATQGSSGPTTGVATDSVCLTHYSELAASLAGPVNTLRRQFTGQETLDVLSPLHDIAQTTLTDTDVLTCLFDHVLFNAALNGSLRATAQKAAQVLAAHGVTDLREALDLFTAQQSVSGLAASELKSLVTSIVGSIGQTVVEDIAKRVAAVTIPGGDLLAAVQILQQASDLTGMVIGLWDLGTSAAAFGAGTLYTIDSPGDIATALKNYPRDLAPDNLGVAYSPEYYGDAGTVQSEVDGVAKPGFFVSGVGHADVFTADGISAYSITATYRLGKLIVSRSAKSVGRDWSTSVVDRTGGAVHVALDGQTGNIITFAGSVGQGDRDVQVFSVATGARLADVDTQIKQAGLTVYRGEYLMLDGFGTMLVNGAQSALWAVNLASGSGHRLPGPSGKPQLTWRDAGRTYWGFDDRKVYLQTTNGLEPSYTLTATPASQPIGVDDAQCAQTLTYVTDDGFLARDDIFGYTIWRARVDPSQGRAAGNRALIASSVGEPSCDTVGADDHGFVTRFGERGGAVWQAKFGYPNTTNATSVGDTAYPVTGLVLSPRLAIVASSYDPHLLGLNLTTGAPVFFYPLDTETAFLAQLASGYLLAVGTRGHLSILTMG